MPDRLADIDIPDELAMFLKFDPEVVQVPDGFYRERIVIDSMPTVTVRSEATDINDVQVLESHTEPCRIPKYRNEVRWRTEL